LEKYRIDTLASKSTGIMFPQLHTILHFRKNGSISKKKIKLITTTVVMEKVLLCQYVIIEITPVVDHVISRKMTIFR